jgi:hypothetical protein
LKHATWLASIALSLLLLMGAEGHAADPYRDLTLSLRKSANFEIPIPGSSSGSMSYQFEWGVPLYAAPPTADFPLEPGSSSSFRRFWDRLLVTDGSVLRIGGETVPLTCVFVDGQDNRSSGIDSPLLPDFVLRIYLVANDFSCTGPVNPLWPQASSRRETWDTYLYYEIRDTTIMVPTEARIRYRWAEFPAVFVQGGTP